MQTPSSSAIVRAALAALALTTSCTREGSCRPAPPDPEPADTVPVSADDPHKPIGQPTPAKPDETPPPK